MSLAGEAVTMSTDFTPEYERRRLQSIAERHPDLLGNDFCPTQFTQRVTRKDVGTQMLYRDSMMEGWSVSFALPALHAASTAYYHVLYTACIACCLYCMPLVLYTACIVCCLHYMLLVLYAACITCCMYCTSCVICWLYCILLVLYAACIACCLYCMPFVLYAVCIAHCSCLYRMMHVLCTTFIAHCMDCMYGPLTCIE